MEWKQSFLGPGNKKGMGEWWAGLGKGENWVQEQYVLKVDFILA